MGFFEKVLEKYLESRDREEFWQKKSDRYAIRRAWYSVMSSTSVITSMILVWYGAPPFPTIPIGIAISILLLPFAHLLSSAHLRYRSKRLIFSNDHFNQLKWIEEEFEIEIDRIRKLKLSKTKEDVLIIQANENFKKKLFDHERTRINLGLSDYNIPFPVSAVEKQVETKIKMDNRRKNALRGPSPSELNEEARIGWQLYEKLSGERGKYDRRELHNLLSNVVKIIENEGRISRSNFVSDLATIGFPLDGLDELHQEKENLEVTDLIELSAVIESIDNEIGTRFIHDLYLIKALKSDT